MLKPISLTLNADWTTDDPVLHFLLANEDFDSVNRLLDLFSNRIDPNLCDGKYFGNKSLLITLTLLPSSGSLINKFIDLYQDKLQLDYQDAKGRTALHYAIILGRVDVVECLIKLGASMYIKDADHMMPMDYLHCAEKTISLTLDMIDINPFRDVKAESNALNDHDDRPLMLQGKYLTQRKDVIERLINTNITLIKYVDGSTTDTPSSMGDENPATYNELLKFAKDKAQYYRVPLDDIFVYQKLDQSEHEKFRNKLLKLSATLSGQSILEQCIAGHRKIEQMLSDSLTKENAHRA